MKFNFLRRRDSRPKPSVPLLFDGDIFDPVTLRYYALRILCGAIMDRRSDCQYPHPFCGPVHQRHGDTPHLLIAYAGPQTDADKTYEFVSLYLCRATPTSTEGLQVDDYPGLAARLFHTDPVPIRKILARPAANGKHLADCGPLLDTKAGDYFAGSLDTSQAVPSFCDPEPDHCQWAYWHTPSPDTPLWEGVPEATYLCIQAHGEFYVFDADYRSPVPRLAACVQVTDSPNH